MAQAKGNKNKLVYAAGAAVLAVTVVWGGVTFVGGGGGGGFQLDPEFDAEAARAQFEQLEDFGNGHVTVAVDYGIEFPASGDHAPAPVPPGFYEDRIITEALVHSLEHGHVVIYYDDPGPAVLEQIREWTLRHQGPWDGVVAVPYPGLGAELVLTAWTRRLRLPEFSADTAWIFIDDFRGRGPENPVR